PEHVEHIGALARARRFALAATIAWTGSVGLDFIAAAHIGSGLAPGSLAILLMLRLVGAGVILGAWGRIRAQPPLGPRGLRVALAASFAAIGFLLSAMGAVAGGLVTPYYGGVLVTFAAYGLVMHARWSRGVVDAAGMVAAFPVTMLLGALLSPRIAAQLD